MDFLSDPSTHTFDLAWISKLTDANWLIVLDVFLDIEQAVNLAPHDKKPVKIDHFQRPERFPQLCPTINVLSLKKYAESRFRAAKLLEDRKVVKSVFASSDNNSIIVFFDRPHFENVAAAFHKQQNDREVTPRPLEAPGLQELLHRQIVQVSWAKLRDGHFADAAESAFKHLNTRVWEIATTLGYAGKDGKPMMEHMFSPNNPLIVLDDLRTQSGRDIQEGYMRMFAGAMMGIRNQRRTLISRSTNGARSISYSWPAFCCTS